MRKILLGLLLWSGMLSVTFAQNFVIFQQTQQQNILFNQNYINYTGSDQTREILNTLSAEWQKSIYQTEYTLFFSFELRVVQTGLNQYSLSMLGRNLNPLGDLLVSGFKINDLLLPDLFSFEAQLVNPNGTIRNQNRYSNVTTANTGTFFEVSMIDPLPMTGVQLRINNLRLSYSPQALQQFNQRIRMIRDYRNSHLSFYIQALKTASWNNIDSLESLKRIHFAATVAYKEFTQSNFQTLNADPEGKFQQSGELKYLIDFYQGALNSMSANAPALFYGKGLEQLKAGNNVLAGDYFRKSQMAVPAGYLPACIMQSRVLSNLGNADSASKLLSIYIGRIPDSLKSDAAQSAGMVFNALQSGMNSKMAVRNNTEALRLLGQSERICSGFQPLGCELTLQKNRKFVVDAGYKQCIGDAKVAAGSGDFSRAESHIKDAQNLLFKYPTLVSQPLLAEQTLLSIKQTQYDKLIISAKSAMNTDMPDQAFEQYQQALSIQKLHKVKPNPELTKSSKMACRAKLIKGFKILEIGLPTMKMAEARKIYEGLLSQVNFNDLQQDGEIKRWSSTLSKKLGSRECEEARSFLQAGEREARSLITAQHFGKAIEKYNQSLEMIRQWPYCGIDSIIVLKQMALLEPARKYEQLLQTASEEVRNGNYPKAFDLLNQSEELYAKEKLNNTGVSQPNREEWTISATTDPFFGYQVADYYYKAKDYQASFRLVKWAVQKGMSPKLTKDLQEKNGIALARKDHASKGNSPDAWVLSYTKGLEKKLKTFKKAYMKQWKSMEK